MYSFLNALVANLGTQLELLHCDVHAFDGPNAPNFYTITIFTGIPLAFASLEDTIRGQRTMGLSFDFGTRQKGVTLTRFWGAMGYLSGTWVKQQYDGQGKTTMGILESGRTGGLFYIGVMGRKRGASMWSIMGGSNYLVRHIRMHFNTE